jgi:Flp pilus assembly protein TadD
MSARENKVKVRLNDQELARLDEMRGDEERAVCLRRLLHERPPKDTEVATYGEALLILTRLAREGRTTAATALEKALRGEQPESELEGCLRDA